MTIIERILTSYAKELKDYENCLDAYKYSGLWTFSKNAWDNIEKRLENFGSDNIGIGISLCNNKPDIKKTKKDLLDWYLLNRKDIELLSYPRKFGFTGSSVEYSTKDKSGEIFTIPSGPRLAHYACRIKELSEKNVVEIGGGFGGTAYHLMKMGYHGTYINFDIPSVSLVAKYFLLNSFPDKKILLYGEDKLSNYKKYDIVLMPHYTLPNLPKKSCDLVINAHSFSELGREQIKEYMKQIDRVCTKYLLHFNHEQQAFLTGKEAVGVDMNNFVNLSDVFPKGWKKIGKWIEKLSESKDLNYYEYLYIKP